MGVFSGPDISESNLLVALDAANPKNYGLTSVEVLVVAGGGGGAADVGGAGGGGGVVYNSSVNVTPGTSVTVTVGAGGAGRAPFDTSAGGNGGNSAFGAVTATGGGGGGCWNGNSGQAGGSGGGGAGGLPSVAGSGGAGTSGQGFAGGSGFVGSYASGGGGGAGRSGSTPTTIIGGNGGDGLQYDISGTPTYYGGGGGGGGGNDSGSDGRGYGGLGGGGTGSSRTGTFSTLTAAQRDGVNGLGGGGGGTGGWNTAGNGGSGVVIVRYPGPQRAIGGTVTRISGFTVHTFTTVGSSTFTPLSTTSLLGLSDFSGGNNFSTASNGPTYSSANSGSIVFDGLDDFSTSGALSGSFASFSVIIWFYPTSVTNYENPIDCNYAYNGSTGNIGPRLEMDNTGSLAWNYSNDTAVNNNFYSHLVVSSGLAANTWHCAAITYNGGTNTSVTYYNGNQTAISRVTIGSPTGFVGVMNNVTIGKGFHLGGAERIFTGRVSNTQIYNRVLTASEIQQNFNALRGRFGI